MTLQSSIGLSQRAFHHGPTSMNLVAPVRNSVGVFDVSHMGEFGVKGKDA